mgnify:CR=1 FL=1
MLSYAKLIRYPTGYRVFDQIPDIRGDPGYTPRYRISVWIPDVPPDAVYLTGHPIFDQIPDIRIEAGYSTKRWISDRRPDTEYPN